jgi:putative ABC transport system permease protein
MKADARSAMRRPDSPPERRWRSVLMSGELAIALMLVVACVQLVRSYTRLQNQERGFQSNDVLTARIALPAARYPTPALRAAFFRRLLADAGDIPDAAAVAAVQLLPLNGVGSLRSVARTDRVADNLPSAFHFVVTPGYFETMGIPRVAGRTFTSEDSAERSRVAILSQGASRRYFPNENPIGRMLRIRDSANAEWEIVGIVGDVRNQRLDRVPQPQIYVPMDQSPAAVMTIVIRSRNHDPIMLARVLRERVQAIDVEQGVADIKPMTQVVGDSAARWRVSTDLFLGFGAVALLLALIGLHSMIAFDVAQRSREIAIRIALGGSRGAIVALLLRSLSAACVSGLAVGLLLSAALARGLSSFLYAVTPVDPIAFGAASVGFLTAAVAAGGWTAYRTTNIHPVALLTADS